MTTTDAIPRTDQARPAGLVSVDGRTYPLKSAKINARAEGGIAATTFAQVHGNSYDEPLDVIYTLRLPADGAVTGYTIRIGKRVIRGGPKAGGSAGRVSQGSFRRAHGRPAGAGAGRHLLAETRQPAAGRDRRCGNRGVAAGKQEIGLRAVEGKGLPGDPGRYLLQARDVALEERSAAAGKADSLIWRNWTNCRRVASTRSSRTRPLGRPSANAWSVRRHIPGTLWRRASAKVISPTGSWHKG